MTDTFRALCAELVSRWDNAVGDPDFCDVAETMDRARAALAEPKPTFDEDWEMLKEQLWYKWKTKGYQGEEFMYDSNFDQAMDEARTALAEGAGVGPTDEELDDLWADIDGGGAIWAWQPYARDVLKRWGTTHPRPIPVAERLPTAEEKHPKLRYCWWYNLPDESWHYCDASYCDFDEWTHWLPTTAIPLPEQNNG